MNETTRQGDRLLVFGDDGSAGADVAWMWVCNHRWPQWRAEVLTATPPPIPPPPPDHRAELTEWDSTHPRLLVAQTELGSVRTLTIAQDPRLMLGRRGDADLIVVGPRNLSRTRALMLGSTTEWILHHPPAPLAIIRSATPVRRVIACIDGSAHALHALRAFTLLPLAVDTEVVIVRVDDGRADTEAGIRRAVDTLEAVGATAVVDTIEGKPTETILDLIDAFNPQLVVLGTRGLTGWKRLRLGSTAGAVVRSAPCSILVACADDATDTETRVGGA